MVRVRGSELSAGGDFWTRVTVTSTVLALLLSPLPLRWPCAHTRSPRVVCIPRSQYESSTGSVSSAAFAAAAAMICVVSGLPCSSISVGDGAHRTAAEPADGHPRRRAGAGCLSGDQRAGADDDIARCRMRQLGVGRAAARGRNRYANFGENLVRRSIAVVKKSVKKSSTAMVRVPARDCTMKSRIERG